MAVQGDLESLTLLEHSSTAYKESLDRGDQIYYVFPINDIIRWRQEKIVNRSNNELVKSGNWLSFLATLTHGVSLAH